MTRKLLAAALFLCIAPLSSANSVDDEAPPASDPARPAIGDWSGSVSWNPMLVTYTWRMNADSTFSSGRAGRAQSGGGVWNAHDAHLTLKYAGGFRYEGEVHG